MKLKISCVILAQVELSILGWTHCFALGQVTIEEVRDYVKIMFRK